MYNDLVQAACEAATLAALRALKNETLGSHSTPAPRDPSSSNGRESESGGLQPFQRVWSFFWQTHDVNSAFPAPPGKKRIPRPNEDKLVDVRCLY